MRRLLLSPHKLRESLLLIFFFLTTLGLSTLTAIAQEGAAAEGVPATETSFLFWLVNVSGPIGGFIFLLSIYFGSVTIRSFMELRMAVAAPPEILTTTTTLIEEKNARDLVTVLQADNSYFSQVLLAGISELKFGLEEAREKLERKAEAITGSMERGISILAVLGTLGPMIGLLGTLKGMISSFSVIAMSGVQMDAGKVAEGISEALVLTFEGVALSVPAIYFYSFFRNRISMISMETTLLADDQLRATSRLLRPKVGPPAQ